MAPLAPIFQCPPLLMAQDIPLSPSATPPSSPELIHSSGSTPRIYPSPMLRSGNNWGRLTPTTPSPWRPFMENSGIDLTNWVSPPSFTLPSPARPMQTEITTSMPGSVLRPDGTYEINELWTLKDSILTSSPQGMSSSGSLI